MERLVIVQDKAPSVSIYNKKNFINCSNKRINLLLSIYKCIKAKSEQVSEDVILIY